MAIPQGRMSTEVVEGAYAPPENRVFYALINYEKGPIAIEDVSAGLLYQNWTLTWNPANNELTAFPETTELPVVIVTVADLVSVSFTFDQNARISFAYTTEVSSYLYWYDTALGQTVTTDLGADAITPALFLDDKRKTQNQANDMLLWYTKANGGTFDLYMLLQRERFLIEHLMASGLESQYIHNIGMHEALRVQITLKSTRPNIPYTGIPIEPSGNPVVTITVPTSSPTYITNADLITVSGIAVDDVAVTQITWENDRGGSGVATGTDTWSQADIQLYPGDNVITITGHDADTNTGIDVLTVTYTEDPVDTEDPVVLIVDPDPELLHSVDTTPVVITGTASDNIGVTVVTWANSRGGGGSATGTTSWTAVVPLAEGANTITITAHDAAGNTGIDDIYIELNYDPPPADTDPVVTITIPTSSPTAAVSVTPLSLGGTAEDDVGVTGVEWSNSRGGGGNVTGIENWTQDVPLYEGVNVITITATDTELNTGDDVITVTYTAPTAPPTPTGLSVTGVTEETITIEWTDSGDTETGYRVKRSLAGMGNFVIVETLPANSTEHTSTGLDDGTEYDFKVHAFNLFGNSGAATTSGTTTASDPNYDFEQGNTQWITRRGFGFSIGQQDAHQGSWCLTLDTIPGNYSEIENEVYVPVTPGGSVNVSVYLKGTLNETLAYGVRFYDAVHVSVHAHGFTGSATTSWVESNFDFPVPVDAVYARVEVNSNGTDGVIHLDTITITPQESNRMNKRCNLYRHKELITQEVS